MTESAPSAASPSPAPPKQKKGLWGTIIAGIGAVLLFIFNHGVEEGSKGLGEWLGGAFFIPVLLQVATCWLSSKLLKPDLKPYFLAVGVPLGQLAVFLFPLFYFGPAALPFVGVDILVIVTCVVWFLVRPSGAPLLLLLIYEVIALVMHFYSLYESGFSQDQFLKGLVSSIIIRVFAIIVLFAAYSLIRKRNPAAAPAS